MNKILTCYHGTTPQYVQSQSEGGAGCITASANLLAPECQLVYQAWRNDQQNTAEQVQKELTVLRKALESYQFVSELKGLMALHTGSEHWQEMLPPFIPLLPSQVRELSEKINDLGLNLHQRIRKYFC